MEERRKDLIELQTYINGVDNEVTMILQSLQWDRKHLLESDPLVSCKHDPSHKVPPDKKTKHEALCWLKHEGYTEDDLKALTRNGEDIGEMLLPSLRRPGPLSTADRLALHCAAVAAAPAPQLDDDLTLPGGAREGKRDGEGDGAGADPRLAELALQRDLRRRRTKYRVVKTKNYSDTLKDIIQTQMEFYTGNTEDDTEDIDTNSQDKMENNETQIRTNIERGQEPYYNENSRYSRTQKRYTQDSSHSKHSSRYDEYEHNTRRSRKTDEYARETRRSDNHRYESNNERKDRGYDYRQDRHSRNDKQCSNREIKQEKRSRSREREERHSRRYKEYSTREIKQEKLSRSRERDQNQTYSRRNRPSRSDEFYSHNNKNQRLTRSYDDDNRREDRRKRRSRERSDKKNHRTYKRFKQDYIQVKEERQSSSEESSSEETSTEKRSRSREREERHSRKYKEYSTREIKQEKLSRSRERDQNQTYEYSRRNRPSRSDEFYSHNDKNERLIRSYDDDNRRDDRRKRGSRERSDNKNHSTYKGFKEDYIQVKEERQSSSEETSSEETSSDDYPDGSYYRPKEYEYEHHKYDKSDRYGHSSKKKEKHHDKKHCDDNIRNFKYDSRKKSSRGYYDVYVKEEPDDF